MASKLPTIDDLEVEGRRVLVRADLNVPLDEGGVADDFRIRSALPVIKTLRERDARVIVCSHLGRPTGVDSKYSMGPVGEVLAGLGGFPVVVAPDVAGDGAQAAIANAGNAVILLENTRFEAGETSNDSDLAGRLAGLAEFFVLDAFGSAHRAHASTVGVTAFLPSAAGPLLLSEVDAFERILLDPERPFVVALGGAKVSDKIGVIEALLPKVDAMVVGGAMCLTMLAARGLSVGTSRVEEAETGTVRAILDSPAGAKVVLPVDIVVGRGFDASTPHQVVASDEIPPGEMGLDIGPGTAEDFAGILATARTIFWNGPMGVFEWPAFATGTRRVAEAIAAGDAYSVAGGGDSVAALREFGLEDAVSHLSTGGGAGLELIEHGTLPGLDALRGSNGS